MSQTEIIGYADALALCEKAMVFEIAGGEYPATMLDHIADNINEMDGDLVAVRFEDSDGREGLGLYRKSRRHGMGWRKPPQTGGHP